MDFVRAFWHFMSIWTGYADQYRNEQYIPRTDFVYEYEAKSLAVNFKNPDTTRVGRNLVIALDHELCAILDWWFDTQT